MKGRIFVAVLLVFAAAVAGRWVTRLNATHSNSRDELRKSFRLDAGARVEVRGINGSVEIKTADTDTAEVRVVRTSDSPGALGHNTVTVEGSASGLVVRGENRRGARGLWRWLWGGGGKVRQEVTITMPRRVELLTRGVNGPVSVGEVDGPVAVEGINGRVEVAGSSGRAEIKGVNGQVKFAVSHIGEGMDIKGVNGNVEVRLRELVNADIDVKGHNGGLTLNVPNVTMQERHNYASVRARLGTGGAQIDIKGVNGQVRFESDAAPSSTGANATTTTTTTVIVPHAPAPPAAPEDESEPPPPPHAPSEEE